MSGQDVRGPGVSLLLAGNPSPHGYSVCGGHVGGRPRHSSLFQPRRRKPARELDSWLVTTSAPPRWGWTSPSTCSMGGTAPLIPSPRQSSHRRPAKTGSDETQSLTTEYPKCPGFDSLPPKQRRANRQKPKVILRARKIPSRVETTINRYQH